MNILIVNQPLNNRGDESAHKGLIRALVKRIPDIKIKVLFIGTYTDSIRQFDVKLPQVEYVCLRPRKIYKFIKPVLMNGYYFLWCFHPVIRKMMNLYRQADYVVCAPGGICMGGFQNWTHLFYLKLAQVTDSKLAYYGRSFGPFPTETKENRRFEELSLEMLNYFSFCSIRDSKTELLAKEFGINYIRTLDSAFLDDTKGKIPNEIKELIGENKYIVFVPNSLIWHYAYKGKIRKETVLDFYSRLLKEIEKKYSEHLILLLPQTFNYPSPDDNDINFFYEFQEYTKDNHLVVIKDIYSSDVQQAIIKESECMIGARYHSIVFAINQTVPFVALSYEHKIAGLLETLGKNDSMIDITSALDDETRMNEAVMLFSNILSNISSDSQATLQAKKIANECLDTFVNDYLCKI